MAVPRNLCDVYDESSGLVPTGPRDCSRLPEAPQDHSGQLNDLLNTLRLIEEEEELQTASVVEQLTKVLEISQETRLSGENGYMANNECH
jgi:hypothetical protein